MIPIQGSRVQAIYYYG